MTSPAPEQHRARRFRHSTKHIRLLLLALGLTGSVIGLGFIVAYVMMRNNRYLVFGVIYILVSLVLLGIREIINELRREDRRRRLDSPYSGGVQP